MTIKYLFLLSLSISEIVFGCHGVVSGCHGIRSTLNSTNIKNLEIVCEQMIQGLRHESERKLLQENIIRSCSVLPEERLRSAIKLNSVSLCESIISGNSLVVSSLHEFHTGDNHFPLHIAVTHDSIKIIPFLLKYNSVNIRTAKEKNTPLHLVRSLEVAQELVNAGANLRATNAAGQTPLIHILCNKSGYGKKLFRASERFRIIRYFCEKDNKLINEPIDTQGNRVLHAMIMKHVLVRFLVDYCGASLDICNHEGQTPIDLAIKNENNVLLDGLQKARVFFRYNNDKYAPIRLLRDDAKRLKTILNNSEENDAAALGCLAQLFAILAQHQPDGKPHIALLGDMRKGYCFKNASFDDLKKLLGNSAESSITYAQECLRKKSEEALENAKNINFVALEKMIQKHRFLLLYDEALGIELLNFLFAQNKEDLIKDLWKYNLNLRSEDFDRLIGL